MNKSSVMLGTLIAAGMLLMTNPASAQSDERNPGACAGNWTLNIDSARTEFRQEGGVSAWVPVSLQLRGNLHNCVEFLELRGEQSSELVLRSGRQTLLAQPYSQQRTPLPRTQDGEGWRLALQPSRQTQEFWLRIPQAGDAAPGDYRGALAGSLMNDAIRNQIIETRAVEVFFNVGSMISLALDTSGRPWIGGADTHYVVDLGTLEEGLQRQFDLMVRSNADITLQVESRNQGRLIHKGGADSAVPFFMQVNHQRINLQTQVQMALPRASMSVPLRVPMQITVGSTRFSAAGEYQDILTVTASARD